jgi:hypothetical protein
LNIVSPEIFRPKPEATRTYDLFPMAQRNFVVRNSIVPPDTAAELRE